MNPKRIPKNLNEIAEKINGSIAELKMENETPAPEGRYKDIDKEKVSEPSMLVEVRRQRERQNRMLAERLLIAVTVLSVALAVLLMSVLFYMTRESLGKRNSRSVKEANLVQTINSVTCKIDKAIWNSTDSTMTLSLSVENRGASELYATIYSFTLIDEAGREYLPDLNKSQVSTKFLGQTIAPETSESATLVFPHVATNKGKWTLLIRNVVDTQHYAWDYMIVLPQIEETTNPQ